MHLKVQFLLLSPALSDRRVKRDVRADDDADERTNAGYDPEAAVIKCGCSQGRKSWHVLCTAIVSAFSHGALYIIAKQEVIKRAR